MAVIEKSGQRVFSDHFDDPALGTTDAVLEAVEDTGEEQEITEGIVSPDVPRNITATAGGTAGDIKAIQVVVEGTNVDGNVITETLPAFTENTTGSVAGSKAFATVTKVTIPAHDDAGATTEIGVGPKLGLSRCLSRDTVINAYLDGTREGTRPTVAFDDDEVEKNTVTLNSALNGKAVIVDYYAT